MTSLGGEPHCEKCKNLLPTPLERIHTCDRMVMSLRPAGRLACGNFQLRPGSKP